MSKTESVSIESAPPLILLKDAVQGLVHAAEHTAGRTAVHTVVHTAVHTAEHTVEQFSEFVAQRPCDSQGQPHARAAARGRVVANTS